MKPMIKRLKKNEDGVALIEFIIIFPFMFLLIFGAIEVARYAIVLMKLDKAAYVMTDAVGQLLPAETTPAAGQVTRQAVLDIAGTISGHMSPYHGNEVIWDGNLGLLGPNTAVIFTSVQRLNGASYVRWRVSRIGALTGVTSVTGYGAGNQLTRTQLAGCPLINFNGDATINGYLSTALNGENFIVGEVFIMYRPLLQAALSGVTGATSFTGGIFFLEPRLLTRVIFVHPRNGPLLDLPNPPTQPLVSAKSACL